ncbi:hypothetical protein OG552_10665 [Streptomyces sp. NBC_01476]|uniref:hypothetical protein n=1 Tax=Streptomyces sp. NBC_01476 TaxID=2903881 RepID=UPI002E2F9C09|nr:hypothetical protein [Streptomyces sp. NBC_01476]
MTARDDGRAAAQAMLRTDPLSKDSIDLIADRVMDAYAPGHREEVIAEAAAALQAVIDRNARYAHRSQSHVALCGAREIVLGLLSEPAANNSTAETATHPRCAHCGEPFGDVTVLTTPGGANRDDYVWHAGRPLCAAAAMAHRELINELGYIIPPMPVLDPNRPDACSEPPCKDSEICAKHELAAEHAEGDHRYCGPECGGGEAL